MQRWADKKVKKLNCIDIQFIKASVLFFAFFIASFVTNWVQKYRWLWLILFIIFALKPLYKILKK